MSRNTLKRLELELVNSVEALVQARQFNRLQPRITQFMGDAQAELSHPKDVGDLYAALTAAEILHQVFRVTLPALEGKKSPKEYSGDGNS